MECAPGASGGYSPLPSQQKFHDELVKFKGFSGPVGSGKSAALCYEAILQSERSPGCTGLIAAPTYSMLRDTTEPMLLALMEELDLDYEHKKTEARILFPRSDSTILLRSLDNPERLRGTNLAWFGLDELSYTKEESWLRMLARLRDPGPKGYAGSELGHRKKPIGYIGASSRRPRVDTRASRPNLSRTVTCLRTRPTITKA